MRIIHGKKNEKKNIFVKWKWLPVLPNQFVFVVAEIYSKKIQTEMRFLWTKMQMFNVDKNSM